MTTIATTSLTLAATDLSQSEANAPLWRTLRTAARVSSESYPGLRAGGLATAAGFGFTESTQQLDAAERRVVVGPDLLDLPAKQSPGGIPDPGQRHMPRVFLSGSSGRSRDPAPAPDGGLKLAIGPDRACVGVDPSAWSSVAEPVLLAVSLCWRFSAIAERLDQLVSWSRIACRRSGTSWSQGRLRRSELAAHRCVLNSLVLDLPCFEGPLIDPRGYFASSRAARLFQALVKRLELDSWRALIDERVEIVEATLEALVEEQRHRDALTFEVALEVLILLALLADITINLFAMTTGS
jgi:hypothetical protein